MGMDEVTQVLTSSRKPAGAEARSATALAHSSMARLWPARRMVGFHLRMAQIASFQAFARRSARWTCRPAASLTLIGRNPGISQTVLSRAAGKDSRR
jgi:hypothetical protein